MFSRKRKREPSIIEVIEQIAQYFANIKDPCGYKCVPTLKVDVREEDVLVTVNNIEQIELSSLCELCELFKNISDVYCDFLTKSVYLVVERNQIDLLASYTYSQLGNDEKHAEIHFLQSAGKDYVRASQLITLIKIYFNAGSFNSMAVEIINKPGIITCHATNIRRVQKGFIFDVCKNHASNIKNVIDFENSLLRFDIDKIKKPSNVAI